MSSANRFITSFSGRPGMLKPWTSGSFLILHARGSMARSNSGQERGSPWQTPRMTLNGLLNTPFIATCVWACLYSDLTVFVNWWGSLKVSSVAHR